jgi:hypothetical protein
LVGKPERNTLGVDVRIQLTEILKEQERRM